MKGILVLFILSFLSATYFSQEKMKVQEVGLSFYNFQNYGMHYKIGDGTNMWRFRVLTGGISFEGDDFISRAFVSTAIGRERRKEIAPNFNFVSGIELNSSYYFEVPDPLSSTISSYYRVFSLGVAGIIGVRYEINDKFYAGAEMLPNITYNRYNYGTITENNLGLNFSSTALLSLGIKF